MKRRPIHRSLKELVAKKFAELNQNAISELCDFRWEAQFVDEGQDEIELRVDFWLGEHDLIIGAHEVKVCLRKAYISLLLDGFKIVPGSRFGATTSANETKIEESYKAVDGSASRHKFDAEAKISNKSFVASLIPSTMISREQNLVKTTDFHIQRFFIKIKSAGNDTWIASDLEGNPIVDQLMNNTVLCKLEMLKNANQNKANALVRAKKTDISIRYLDPLARLSINKKRVLSALLLKTLSSDRTDDPGVFHLSQSELTYE